MNVHAHRSEQDAKKRKGHEHQKGRQDQQGTNHFSHRCSPTQGSAADKTAPLIVVPENSGLSETSPLPDIARDYGGRLGLGGKERFQGTFLWALTFYA